MDADPGFTYLPEGRVADWSGSHPQGEMDASA